MKPHSIAHSPISERGNRRLDLYVVAERSIFESDEAWVRAVEAVCAVDDRGMALQVRVKGESPERGRELAVRAREATRGSRVPVFLNGTTEDARELGYEGVHWPEALTPPPNPLPPSASSGRSAGEEGGPDWIGASVHSPEAALRAEHAGADFVVAGTIFEAGSKEAPGAGLGHLRAIVGATSLPVLAIGGVTAARVASCIEAGASGVAVVSAVLRAPDNAAAIRELRKALDAARAKAGVG